MEKLKEKVSESLASVLPITAIVLVLSILVVPMEIGAIMENPVLDQEKILLMQRKMLVAKKGTHGAAEFFADALEAFYQK